MLYIENTEQRGTGMGNGSEWSNGTVHFDRTKGGPTFSKLFRLDRTDPFSFRLKFLKILVKWIVPMVMRALILGSVHTTPEKFENAALFFRFGLIFRPHWYVAKKELSENAVQTGGIWKRRIALCVLVCTENILKTMLFENSEVTIIIILLCPSFPQTQIQND